MPNATFFIEGRCYGSAPAPTLWCKEDARVQWSLAYLCPTCGEVWARVVVEGQPFFAAHVSCRKHRTHSLEVPGSIYDPDLLAAFPRPVLERELALALAQYDREQSSTA